MLASFALCGSSGQSDDPPPAPTDPNREITESALGVGGPACSGASIDPPPAELQQADSTGAWAPLLARYPLSSTSRVIAGGRSLHGTPRNTAEALRLYAEAQRLHDQGCGLPPREEWSRLVGVGLAHMFDGHHAQAIAPLSTAAQRWPDSATTHYNLACSYCLTNDLEGCRRELASTLEVSAAGRRPAWETDAPSVGHYVELSGTDPDLTALRATPAYEATVGPYRGRP
jgi:hypothetical protein